MGLARNSGTAQMVPVVAKPDGASTARCGGASLEGPGHAMDGMTGARFFSPHRHQVKKN